MGRYYSGDINGKFGFGSQDSDDGEYFGAESYEPSHIPYALYRDDIPDAIKKLHELLKEFNKKQVKSKKKVHIDMDQEEFFKITDTDWYQDKGNALLASRIAMGLEIYHFHQKCPDDDIFFEAEM